MNYRQADLPPIVLSIAGHDPTGGAGITQDAAVIRWSGCYPLTVPTALTIQDTRGVKGVIPVEPAWFREQLRCVTDDLAPDVIKIGMLGTGEIAKEVLHFLETQDRPVVLDPVLSSSDGEPLVDVIEPIEELYSHVSLITPNLPEAEYLAGRGLLTADEIDEAGWLLMERGVQAVLIKGGHRQDKPDDVLFWEEGQVIIEGDWIEGPEVHGTGCALSSLIACKLAKGDALDEAVAASKKILAQKLGQATPLGLGRALLTW